jgi:diphosphomevalonate decarboxylase
LTPTNPTKATTQAHPNIALIKYWGKRDTALFLPQTPSLSMTLSGLSAKTTVEFSTAFKADRVELDGQSVQGRELERFTMLLDRVRGLAGISERARIASRNDFPKAAGLASSAAGGAALTSATALAAGLDLSAHELSRLARQFSGSACRSIEGGFCEWQKGVRSDGEDSFAVQIAPSTHWPELRMVVTICSEAKKAMSSRLAMQHSVDTSPFFEGWVRQVDLDLELARSALLARDLDALGPIVETNACRMHAVAMGAHPPTIYLKPVTLEVIEAVHGFRRDGIQAWFTLDAGPNPVVLCLDTDAACVAQALSAVPGVLRTVTASPGEGATLLDEHLF